MKSSMHATKTGQDLTVTAFGLATSAFTATTLALLETKCGIAVYSFMCWSVIPAGALCAGFAASSGYYLGAKLFHHRPTRLMLFNTISVALSTWVVLNFLRYCWTEVNGQHISQLASFGQFMRLSITNQSIGWVGSRPDDAVGVGQFGYLIAALQVLGFAAGGFFVHWYLRAAPYCAACGKYLRRYSSTTRYTADPGQLAAMHSDLAAALHSGDSSAAVQLVSSFGEAKEKKGMHLSATLKLWKCETCPRQFFESSVRKWNGRDWKAVAGLHMRDYIGSAGPPPAAAGISAVSQPPGTSPVAH
ncbi:MAG TPA: hypothetical protein VFA04_21855 [Bryobacteraceae bacterium]|nr:hypothetical protein [Bryobacteraceae bacterium]